MKVDDKVLAQQIGRFENLKNEIVMQYSDEIDYDGDRDFIITDALFEHLVKGDLNDFYESPLLDEMDEEEKNTILNVVNKYSYLLFYDNDSSNWFDSVDMPLIDYETISLKLLNYYDFLIEMFIKGGEKALKELAKYADYDAFGETSVVDFLIGTFISKEALLKVITDMSLEDGPFKNFDTDKRSVLLMNPDGVLYHNDTDTVTYINPIELMNIINQREENFVTIISNISSDYLLSVYEKKKK